jgi:hypothetical protein
MLPVVDDVPVDSEASAVTSSILRIYRLSAYRDKVCVHTCEYVCVMSV